jgi:hypothetical protein
MSDPISRISELEGLIENLDDQRKRLLGVRELSDGQIEQFNMLTGLIEKHEKELSDLRLGDSPK